MQCVIKIEPKKTNLWCACYIYGKNNETKSGISFNINSSSSAAKMVTSLCHRHCAFSFLAFDHHLLLLHIPLRSSQRSELFSVSSSVFVVSCIPSRSSRLMSQQSLKYSLTPGWERRLSYSGTVWYCRIEKVMVWNNVGSRSCLIPGISSMLRWKKSVSFRHRVTRVSYLVKRAF